MKTNNTMKGLTIFCIALACSLGSCSQVDSKDTQETSNETEQAATQKTFDLLNAKAEIQATNDVFTDLVAQKDSIALTKMYTTDAKFMVGGGPSAVGHQEIQSAMYGIFKSGITGAQITTKEVFGNEDLLVEESNVLLFVGDQQVADEKAIVVWKKVNDEWKLFRDIFNSNLSPTQE